MSALDNVQLHLVDSLTSMQDFLRWMNERMRYDSVLGIDTETTGLNPNLDTVRTVQIGDLEQGWTIPWDDWRGLAKEVILGYPGQWVLHNSKFDIRFISHALDLRVQDWPWHRTHDCMAMAHILDSQRPKGLKQLASKYVDGRAAAMQSNLDDAYKKNGWTFATVPINYPPYWQYGALDPVLTVHMYMKMYPTIKEQFSGLYDLEMGAVRVTAKMEENGARIDLAYSHRKRNELMRYAVEARQYLTDTYGLDNPTPRQLFHFFTAAGVELPVKHTASGNQSMDKEVMDAIDHEVAQIVQGIKRAEKWSHTYFDNFIKFADSDSYIHPSINPMAARTGRMSITEPALQTLPRIGDTIRNAFIASEDHQLITCDYDQIEARLTAHFSQDPGLIAAFHAEGDFFCNVASSTYGYDVRKGMKERDLIKGVVYGKVYGATVPKMALTAKVPLQQMEIANGSFERSFPGVRTMQQRIIGLGQQRARAAIDKRGHVVTPYGRVLRSDERKEYTLVNYLIQCHAAEILKKKIVELDAALPNEVKLILPVHDEVIFDSPIEMTNEVLPLIGEVMSAVEDYAVPITATAEAIPVGESWGYNYR